MNIWHNVETVSGHEKGRCVVARRLLQESKARMMDEHEDEDV